MLYLVGFEHGLRTPGEEIAFSAPPKINSHPQFLRYGQSIFCLLHRSKFSDFFDLCLHWLSGVRDFEETNQILLLRKGLFFQYISTIRLIKNLNSNGQILGTSFQAPLWYYRFKCTIDYNPFPIKWIKVHYIQFNKSSRELIQQNPNPIMEYDRNSGSSAHNAKWNYRF